MLLLIQIRLTADGNTAHEAHQEKERAQGNRITGQARKRQCGRKTESEICRERCGGGKSFPEAMRWASLQVTPRGCLSRSAAGIRGRSLIVNLPGSEKAAKENLGAVLEALLHAMDMLASDGSSDHHHHH